MNAAALLRRDVNTRPSHSPDPLQNTCCVYPCAECIAERETTRYELTTTLATTISERRHDLAATRADFEQFCRDNAGNRGALASIYDWSAMKYVAGWWGGERARPVDTMAPVERMMRRAVSAGQRVLVLS